MFLREYFSPFSRSQQEPVAPSEEEEKADDLEESNSDPEDCYCDEDPLNQQKNKGILDEEKSPQMSPEEFGQTETRVRRKINFTVVDEPVNNKNKTKNVNKNNNNKNENYERSGGEKRGRNKTNYNEEEDMYEVKEMGDEYDTSELQQGGRVIDSLTSNRSITNLESRFSGLSLSVDQDCGSDSFEFKINDQDCGSDEFEFKINGLTLNSALGVFVAIPDEMRIHILSFLDVQDLLINISRLNTYWKELIEDDILWKLKFGRVAGSSRLQDEMKRKNERKKSLELEFQEQLTALEDEYQKKKLALLDRYNHERVKLHKRTWKSVYTKHLLNQKYWELGQAEVDTILVGRTINCLLFDDEKDLVICGNHCQHGQAGEIKFWDVKKKQCYRTITAHDRWVRGLYWDSNLLFSCSNDKTIKVWNVRTGTLVKTYSGHINNVPMIQVSASNNRMISCSRDKSVKLWDIERCVAVNTYHGHASAVNCIAMNIERSRVVSGDRGGSVCVWDIRKKKPTNTINTGLDVVQCIEFTNPEATNVVLGGGSSRRDGDMYPFEVWDVSQKTKTKSLYGHVGFNWTMQYDYPTRKLVTAGADRSICVWDLEKGTFEREVTDRDGNNLKSRHGDSIYTLRFGASRIVSGSKDRRMKIWDFSKKNKKRRKGLWNKGQFY